MTSIKRSAALALFAILSPGAASQAQALGGGTSGASPAAEAPGTLVETIDLPDIDPAVRDTGAQSMRLRYRSTSAWHAASVVVSASAFVPAGTPPAGGWPVIALGHGTTGIRQECGPSLHPNLMGGAGMIANFVKNGFAIVVADYEGLGEPGVHDYLNATAAGYNIIDSVKAFQQARPGVLSKRWLAVGGSQGGAAVWAANEDAAARAPELQLVGVVSLVPAANFNAYPDLAAAGTFGPDQRGAYIGLLTSLARGHPSLDLNQYRHGSAARNWDVLTYCTGPHVQERNEALAQVTNEELKPASPAATQRLKALIATMALPRKRTTAPMLVVYAGRDTFLDPAWTRAAIEKACSMGSQIEAEFQPESGHGVGVEKAVPWIASRFAGVPPADKCG